MKKFTITTLKKQLAQKTKDELIKEIATLCQTFPQVKEYYKAQGDDIQDILKKYQGIIEQEFIEGKRRGLPKARFSTAKKAVKDFQKLTKNPELIAELMLTYVESISWFNEEYMPDSEEFYVEPAEMFENVLGLLNEHNLLAKFEPRVRKIVNNATDGWGYQDDLQDRYEEMYGEWSTGQ